MMKLYINDNSVLRNTNFVICKKKILLYYHLITSMAAVPLLGYVTKSAQGLVGYFSKH